MNGSHCYPNTGNLSCFWWCTKVKYSRNWTSAHLPVHHFASTETVFCSLSQPRLVIYKGRDRWFWNLPCGSGKTRPYEWGPRYFNSMLYSGFPRMVKFNISADVLDMMNWCALCMVGSVPKTRPDLDQHNYDRENRTSWSNFHKVLFCGPANPRWMGTGHYIHVASSWNSLGEYWQCRKVSPMELEYEVQASHTVPQHFKDYEYTTHRYSLWSTSTEHPYLVNWGRCTNMNLAQHLVRWLWGRLLLPTEASRSKLLVLYFW